MQIIIVGDQLNTPSVRRAAREAGAELTCVSSRGASSFLPEGRFDVLLAGCDHGDNEPLRNPALTECCAVSVPLSGGNLASGVGNVSHEEAADLNAYFAYGGPENLKNAFALLRQLLSGKRLPLPKPIPVPLDAIFSEDGRLFTDRDAFLEAQARRYPVYVGMLTYRGRWADQDLEVEHAIIDSLAARNIGVIPAFTDGSPNQALGNLTFQQAVERFFCKGGKPVIDLFLNFQFFGAKASGGEDMFTRAAECFAGMDIPIVRPAGLARSTREQWESSDRPYAMDLPTNFIVPEYQGMIEPIHVSCSDGQHDRVPIPDRIDRLTGRIERWIALRHKPNGQKRVAIILHNAPCSGVEATVGMATDLDAFQSAVDILRRMEKEGYSVKSIPVDGRALKKRIFERKAYSDFRWTSAEDIAASGGAMYRMETAEYLRYYNALPEDSRKKMEQSWGVPPGEAMTVDGKLLVTGIPFGNVLVMVQPKRGCYGAKCTGEVCRILQDPSCPPSHQYLATYWYLEHIFHADAVIHLGTHGSLEYLPGKQSGLSASCFSDAAIGTLVDLYPYNASVVAQALIARRRAYAVTLSYLPSPGQGLTEGQRKLERGITAYFAAKEQNSGQLDMIRRELETMLRESPAAQSVMRREPDYDKALTELRSLLAKTDAARKGEAHRAFGSVPDEDWIRDYISELWLTDPAVSAFWKDADGPAQRESVRRLIDDALRGKEDLPSSLRPLAEDARSVAAALKDAVRESDALMAALDGRFIPPTRGGDASFAGREILPTGRNIHGGEQDRVPTPYAYQRGRQAAEALLDTYRKDTGALPEKAALNMTSLDVTRTGGEQLGQFLSLMGVIPVWGTNGRVEGLSCIPLSELGRPRIDVTVHISSVMRDAWPQVLVLMDQAVRLAAEQDEPPEQNRVRANSRSIDALGEDGTSRIFGGQPGTYTSAVGLALKASAWKTEEDLAKYFLDASSYLYGENKNGVRAPGAFAANVRQVDLTGDITASRRTDGGASSYSARVQGGFRLAAKALGSKKKIRQYMGESSSNASISIVPLADHVTRAVRDTLLNDVWREQVMERGYDGGAELMVRMQNLFDTQCVCGDLSDSLLDSVAKQYLLDEEMQKWFAENNPHALEESGRRFLELNTRGKWNGDPQVLAGLRRAYLRAEGDLEDGVSGLGELQGGSVDVISHEAVKEWSERLRETESVMKRWKP